MARESGKSGAASKRAKRPAITLDDDDSQPLYERVKDAVKARIATGRLDPGERLPTLRELSADLHVSYATVARGMRELVVEGVLEAKPGRGTRVVRRRVRRLGHIGILGEYSYSEIVSQSPFFRSLLHLAQDRIVGAGETVVYRNWDGEEPISGMFNGLQVIDGLLLLNADITKVENVDSTRRLGVPVIAVGYTFDHWDLPTVDSANVRDAYRAVAALQHLGHQRIALLTSQTPHRTAHGRRAEGFRQGMSAGGHADAAEQLILKGPKQWANRILAAEFPPTAVIIDGVSHFPEFYQELKGTHREPGKGLMVCAYDEDLWNVIAPLGIEHLRIDQPVRQIASTAVDELLRVLDDRGYLPGSIEIPSTVVHVRGDGSAEKL